MMTLSLTASTDPRNADSNAGLTQGLTRIAATVASELSRGRRTGKADHSLASMLRVLDSAAVSRKHSSLFAQLSAKHDPSLHPILEALTLLRRTQLALFESNARLDESTLVSIHANCARVESLLVNHQDSFHTDLFSASLLHHARTLRLTLLADALCNECNFKDASLALFKARQSLKQWVQQLNEVQSELGLELTSVLEKTTLSDEVPATAITSVTSSVPRRASSPPRRGNSLYEAISSAATNMASSIAKVGVSGTFGQSISSHATFHVTLWLQRLLDSISDKFELVFHAVLEPMRKDLGDLPEFKGPFHSLLKSYATSHPSLLHFAVLYQISDAIPFHSDGFHCASPAATFTRTGVATLPSLYSYPPHSGNLLPPHLPSIISLLQEHDYLVNTHPDPRLESITTKLKRIIKPASLAMSNAGSTSRERSRSRSRPASAGSASTHHQSHSSNRDPRQQRKSVSTYTLTTSPLNSPDIALRAAHRDSLERLAPLDPVDHDPLLSEKTPRDGRAAPVPGTRASDVGVLGTVLGFLHRARNASSGDLPAPATPRVASLGGVDPSSAVEETLLPPTGTGGANELYTIAWTRRHCVLFWDRKVGVTYVVLRACARFVLCAVLEGCVGDGEEEGELWRIETLELMRRVARQLGHAHVFDMLVPQ